MTTTTKNATITGAEIGNSENIGRGMLSSWIQLDYGGSASQGFGGYRLDSPDDGPGCATKWILGVMRAAGVDEWGKVKGRNVRADIENGRVVAIGHITNDLWFVPATDLA